MDALCGRVWECGGIPLGVAAAQATNSGRAVIGSFIDMQHVQHFAPWDARCRIWAVGSRKVDGCAVLAWCNRATCLVVKSVYATLDDRHVAIAATLFVALHEGHMPILM